jgi:hypothetical protein
VYFMEIYVLFPLPQLYGVRFEWVGLDQMRDLLGASDLTNVVEN